MVSNRDREGRFTQEHTDTDLLDAVRTHEPAATSEVAEELGISRQAADYRLRRLQEEGQVESKKIAAARVWFTGAPPTPTDRPDPVEWDESRREVLARDGYTCQECGADVTKTGSEIHHKTPLAGGGDNSLSNLETLCPNCHGEKHQGAPLATVLDVFNQVRSPAIVSADVADQLDCSRQTARRKLNDLYERGVLDRRKTAGIVVYWRPEDGAESAREPAETPSGEQADRTDPPPTSPATRGQDAVEIDATDAAGGDLIGDALDGWSPEGVDPKSARGQTRRTVEFLQDHAPDPYRRSELEDALAGESSYTPTNWWVRAVQPGLKHLADHGLVEYTRNRGYRWVGDGEV